MVKTKRDWGKFLFWETNREASTKDRLTICYICIVMRNAQIKFCFNEMSKVNYDVVFERRYFLINSFIILFIRSGIAYLSFLIVKGFRAVIGFTFPIWCTLTWFFSSMLVFSLDISLSFLWFFFSLILLRLLVWWKWSPNKNENIPVDMTIFQIC